MEANHAVEAKKCTKKWDTRAKLLFYMLIKPTDIIYLPFPGLMVPNRDFKMPWHRQQREHKKNRFYKQNNYFVHAWCLFVHFFAHFYMTTTWKCLISYFMEYVNKQQQNFISLSEQEWIWFLESQLQEGSTTFDKESGQG